MVEPICDSVVLSYDEIVGDFNSRLSYVITRNYWELNLYVVVKAWPGEAPLQLLFHSSEFFNRHFYENEAVRLFSQISVWTKLVDHSA